MWKIRQTLDMSATIACQGPVLRCRGQEQRRLYRLTTHLKAPLELQKMTLLLTPLSDLGGLFELCVCCCDKNPDKKQCRGERSSSYSSNPQATVTEKSQWQEPEEASHIIARQGQRAITARILLASLVSFLLHSLGQHAQGMVLPIVGWIFPSQLAKSSTIPPTHAHRPIELDDSSIETLLPGDSTFCQVDD